MTGKELKVILDALGLSYADLADELKYSSSAVHKWAARNANVPETVLPKIFAFVKRTIDSRKQKQATVLTIIARLEVQQRIRQF